MPATLGGLAARYVEGRRARGEFTRRTADSVYCVLIALVEHVGYHAPAAHLTAGRIDHWAAGLAVCAATKRRYLGHVRLWCQWMVANGHLKRDPSTNLHAPREPRRLPRNMRHDWVSAIVAECDDVRDELIVLLMVQLGLRCKEVAGLQIGDIDPADETVRVVGKGGHERIVPLTAEARAALGRYVRAEPVASGPLIRSRRRPGGGISAGYVSTLVSRVCARAGVHKAPYDGMTAHALRHTAATDVVDQGGDVRDVQTMLGHASLATSSIYIARADARRLREVMEGRWYGPPG